MIRVLLRDPGKAKNLWWGPAPLPAGATCLGQVSRSPNCWEGALIKMPTGIYCMGNAGVLSSLPHLDVREAIAEAGEVR